MSSYVRVLAGTRNAQCGCLRQVIQSTKSKYGSVRNELIQARLRHTPQLDRSLLRLMMKRSHQFLFSLECHGLLPLLVGRAITRKPAMMEIDGENSM